MQLNIGGRQALGWTLVGATLGLHIATAVAPWPQFGVLEDISPAALLLSLGIFSIALAQRAGPLLLCAAAIAVVPPALRVVPEFAHPAAQAGESSSSQLTIVTINLWTANSNRDAVRALIEHERPHIIIVQEAAGAWKPFLEALAPDYQLQAGCRDGSDCNVAVLSRFELVEQIAPPTHAAASIRVQLPPELGGDVMEIVGVHLTRPHNGYVEAQQINELNALNRNLGPRAIVAGDFNMTPWSRALWRVEDVLGPTRRTHAVFTWPSPARRSQRFGGIASPLALAPIDHVFAGAGWATVSVERGNDVGSDHYPVIVRLSRAS
jgi:vancomycin resistance protein VanJ